MSESWVFWKWGSEIFEWVLNGGKFWKRRIHVSVSNGGDLGRRKLCVCQMVGKYGFRKAPHVCICVYFIKIYVADYTQRNLSAIDT